MQKQTGFTIIELLVVITIASVACIFFFLQKADLTKEINDQEAKADINAMYYALRNDFYKKNHYYPKTINKDILQSVDSDVFVDPSGIKISNFGSAYSYEATGCDQKNHCKNFTLRTDLTKENEYIKSSKDKLD